MINYEEKEPSAGDLVEVFSKKGYAQGYAVKKNFSFAEKFFSVKDGEKGVYLHRLSQEPSSLLYQYAKIFFHKSGVVCAVLITNLRIIFKKDNL